MVLLGNHRHARGIRNYLRKLFRPWKFITFLFGAMFFIIGARYWAVPTWDVGVSILMSILCFLIAPWAVDIGTMAVLARGRGWVRKLSAATLLIYLVASGSYEVYNAVRMGQHPVTYWQNLAFSVPVTIAAGLVWRYDGSLLDLLRDIRSKVRGTSRR